ncbi:MAG: DNA alkylation repair protein [Flavobacteriales bacterium]|nr:DNA alkylation repair protein [Flavobacteriales bacterium]
MAEALKLGFSREYISRVAQLLSEATNAFDRKQFLSGLKGKAWEESELKTRAQMMTDAMHAALPGGYARNIDVIVKVAPLAANGFYGIIFPEYVSRYGRDHWDISMKALQQLTISSTSEFAIRPFLEMDTQAAMKMIGQWATHENHHVRRLASEGCRPRLPWGTQVKALIRDPEPGLAVLEKLMHDESLYVRKSVANHLNDISKDHPDRVLAFARKWKGKSAHGDWILKHALRTLLKTGNPEALKLIGVKTGHSCTLQQLSCDNKVAIGDDFHFSFTLHNAARRNTLLRIEYAIDFVKSGGQSRPKKFFIAQREFGTGNFDFARKKHFGQFTTRTHFAGKHVLTIFVNGEALGSKAFRVI